MAKAQGSATMKAPREAALDASMEHPALTPLVRRLANELWEIIQAKAEADGLPIEEARLRGHTDVEGVDEAYIVVLCAAPAERTFAFHRGAQRRSQALARWHGRGKPGDGNRYRVGHQLGPDPLPCLHRRPVAANAARP